MATGARSLSDLVRHAMRELVTGANQDSVLASTVNQHAALVKELEQKIERLSTEIASLRAESPMHENERTENNPGSASRLDASEIQPTVDCKELPSSRTIEPPQAEPGSQVTRVTKA